MLHSPFPNRSHNEVIAQDVWSQEQVYDLTVKLGEITADIYSVLGLAKTNNIGTSEKKGSEEDASCTSPYSGLRVVVNCRKGRMPFAQLSNGVCKKQRSPCKACRTVCIWDPVQPCFLATLFFLFGRETAMALMSWSRTANNILKIPYNLELQCLGGSYAYPKVQHPAIARDRYTCVMLPPSPCYQKDSTKLSEHILPFSLFYLHSHPLNGQWMRGGSKRGHGATFSLQVTTTWTMAAKSRKDIKDYMIARR